MKIEPTDENHIDHIDNDEEWKSIETLEDSGIDVEIEPTDENHIDQIDNYEEWKSIETLED